ncbi:pimeloyl-ACP methyl ester carboxylesterase [Okibacterium sp. HSC-33S16]|uniref:alpha/beta fold hydrolase n=1 Tax=Okibacterium sp. HSC-33S16 TaxID=2910965 RepID=UPI00209E716E|nr:alpha/beta hydrolase [Okibacterium sp. HSC-33S16]MCP2032489.1 pimeloyl-ACP methyl ester carboxylesterase [Okibacterium sp. HSC-33S16]
MGTMKPKGGSGPDASAGLPDAAGAFPHIDGVSHRFITVPGLQIHVAEAGTGSPLLLLHAFPQHWWGWRKMIPLLAQNFHVICPDLRGAGWTDAPPGGYTSEQLVADAIALLDALSTEKTDIIGCDEGGYVGFRFCLFHPERVGKFICLATPHPYPEFHVRMLLHLVQLWPMFATSLPGIGPRLLGQGSQRLPRMMMETDDLSVRTQADLEYFLAPLREPARARAGSALYRDFTLKDIIRSLAGAYRGTRLSTPTRSLYGKALYGNDQPPGKHPEILSGYEDHTDDFDLEHIPGAGYYMAEEQPEVIANRAREFFLTST